MTKKTEPDPEDNEERLLGERYRLERELGRGGMAVVWLAEDLHLHTHWAVKEIPKKAGGYAGQTAEDCLLAEMEMLRTLDHPALPKVVDAIDTDTRLYLVMEYIQGETLEAIRRRLGVVSEKTAREWMKQLARVLLYLHSQKPPVIYRDLKPSNIMRRPDGRLALIDLGTARVYKTAQEKDTRVLGTQGYAAPEQFIKGRTDIRSDLYALGVTVTELVTGISPEEDPYRYGPHPFAEIRPELSENLGDILNRCMAFAPEKRFADCRELLQALQKKPRKGFRMAGRKGRLSLLGMAAAAEVFSLVLTGGGRPSRENTEKDPQVAGLTENLRQAREGGLTEAESRKLLASWEALRDEPIEKDAEYLRFLLEAGQTYLYDFLGKDGSLRERIVRARPFFAEAEAVAATPESEEDGELHGEIRNYNTFCDFYMTYVLADTGLREPGKEELLQLLEAARTCLDKDLFTETDDENYLRIRLYQGAIEILSEFRQGFAAEGVREEEVLAVTDTMIKRMEEMQVNREMVETWRQQVLAEAEQTAEKIRQTYRNVLRWKEAGSGKEA